MKFRAIDQSEPMWNDPEQPREPRVSSLDDLVQLRTHSKRLQDVTLPEGFRLVTLTPKQAWVEHQLVWVFILGWAPVDMHGRRRCEDRYLKVSRYHPSVADEVQMEWALKDFMRDLDAAEVPSAGRHARLALVRGQRQAA